MNIYIIDTNICVYINIYKYHKTYIKGPFDKTKLKQKFHYFNIKRKKTTELRKSNGHFLALLLEKSIIINHPNNI